MIEVKERELQTQLSDLLHNKIAMSSVIDFETALDWAVWCQRLSRSFIRGAWQECLHHGSVPIASEVDVDRNALCKLAELLDGYNTKRVRGS